MKLHEFQTKAIFKREGIPLPASFLSSSPAQAKQAATEIGYPVILKAQSLVSGRGKAGGIRLTKNDDETEQAASDILSIKLRGISIQNLLVEKAILVDNELFLGIYYDAMNGMPSFALSTTGGLSIEDKTPEASPKTYIQNINPLLGLQPFMVRHACANLRIEPEQWKAIEQLATKLWYVYGKYDASLAEINSMVFDQDGRAIVLDGKLIIDDNALFRQREFIGFLDPAITSFAQAEARKFDHQLVRMDGTIAIVTNGQGLASAVVDSLDHYGYHPALILILDENATASSVTAACQLVQDDPSVKAVLIYIYSNMGDCHNFAQGIRSALQTSNLIPYFVLLEGSDCMDVTKFFEDVLQVHFENELNEAIRHLTCVVKEEHVDSD